MLMAVTQRRLLEREERLYHAFCKFDLNHDGKISESELKEVLKTHSEAECKALMHAADFNHDGSVYFCVLLSAL